jgi:cytochrome c oxidase cbb3-type subunit 3
MSELSTFWSGWVIVLTAGNILGCVWLIWWTMRKRPSEAAEGDVTGHTWDGDLQEYNNPLPRWWLWLFYITIVFGLGYLLLYPGFGNFAGFLGWTAQNQYDREMAVAAETYGPIFAKYSGEPIPVVAADPEANEMGKRLYLTYCSQCHGSTASGGPGFPNLTDNDWLWGGKPEQIQATIANGRTAVMPAWQAILGDNGVEEVAEYVITLSGRTPDDSAKAEAGKALFATNCAGCHMPNGTGNQALGAPNLTDDIWLYGGSKGAIVKTIAAGRNGVMPAQKKLLGDDKVHLLAAYVYSLSND